MKRLKRNTGAINSNVAIELGFAAHAIGRRGTRKDKRRWNRTICIMNTKWGEPELLPFDLKQRRFPLTYQYSRFCRKPENMAFRALLTNAVTDALSGQHKAIERAKDGLSVECVTY